MFDLTPTPEPTPQPLVLRDYQVTDIERLRNEFRRGCQAPIYQLSTGGGKTVVFSFVIKGAVEKKTRTLVLAHRRELIRQASAKLTALGVEHGIMAAGMDKDHDAMVIVASIQTIARRLDTLPQFGLIVIDECHHAVATTWTKLLASQEKAKLLGVTATPARLDGKGLGRHCGGHFDSIICGPSMQELVDQGYLARCRVLVPAVTIDVRGLRTIAGDYDEGQLEERAQGVTGDAVTEFKKLPAGSTAMVFCVTVKHAENVAAAFAAAGYKARAVHGGMSKPDRDEAIQGLSDGRVEVLTSCEIISEGLDVPSVACVILLRPTQSLTMCLQQIGRGMRPKVDGAALVVLDHAKNCIAHGLPTEPRVWTLDGVEKGPEKKTKPEPWSCLACGTLNAAQRPTCSECGALKPWVCSNPACQECNPGEVLSCRMCGTPRKIRRPIEQDDGEMAELTADRFANITRLSYGQLLSRRRSEAELAAYAKAKGYKPGWVWYKLREQEEKFSLARRAS